jgi:anti-sigma regulatory factor (Ser/Thr protein kinase)
MRASEIHSRTDFQTDVEREALHAVAANGGYGGAGSSERRERRGVGISVELEPGATAAGEARAALAALDGRIDPDALDDIRLLVSELVTNSVRHSGAERELVRLSVTGGDRTVRVEVTDAGRGFEPRARTAAADEVGGWGLHLVDRLADSWGVEIGRRTRVWFELDR